MNSDRYSAAVMAPPNPSALLTKSATEEALMEDRKGSHNGIIHTGSFTTMDRFHNLFISTMLVEKSAGKSLPSAIRAAPVKVAKSTTNTPPLSSSKSSPSVAATRASASISRPSASVLVISVVLPLRARMTSPGLRAAPEMEFSTIGRSRRTRTGKALSTTSSAKAIACAAPVMSLFMLRIPPPPLMFKPPVSKVTPLPTITTKGNFCFVFLSISLFLFIVSSSVIGFEVVEVDNSSG
mmetsp:Transcript_13337/g.20002  ORF Transcript_13337/g.20002 Transcript_13337/m.20002 type:complete len:238 (-) Transcript_13337:239-952(-)